MQKVTIYTDGSSHGNPGPGGYGAVLMYTSSEGKLYQKELSEGFLRTTNNRMELLAPIRALQRLNRPCEVTLYSDSKYLVDAINKHWVTGWQKRGWKKADQKPVKNVDLWQELLAAMEPHQMTFVWVKGHAENIYNERCDALANLAAEAENKKVDEGFVEESTS